ncbi:MAG TPA: uroporphyrinogen-III synthase [Kofleriaceae bacterium]
MLRAVLTREDVEAYAAQLSPQGIEVVAMPVTQQLADANDRDVLARALQTGPFAAVVVTSRHAAIFLAAALLRTSSTANDLGEIWAVGPATRQSLDGEGLTSHYPPGVHDGAELARALMASRDLRGQRVLVPRAEQGRSEAIELLREAGADVVDVVAYRTHAVAADHPSIAAGRELLTGDGVAVCAVFSPSQVAALAAIVGPLVEVPTQFCAIGETTAAALRAAGVTQIGVAATPTPDGLATAVRTLLATTP